MRKGIILLILTTLVLSFTGCGKEEVEEKPTYEQGGIQTDDSYIIDQLVTSIDEQLQNIIMTRIVKYDEKIYKDNIIYKIFIDPVNGITYTYDKNKNIEIYERLYITYFKKADETQWYSEYLNGDKRLDPVSKYIPIISLQKNQVSYGGREIFNTIICNVLIVDNYKYYVNEETLELVGLEETTEDDKKIVWIVNLSTSQEIEMPNFDKTIQASYSKFLKEIENN